MPTWMFVSVLAVLFVGTTIGFSAVSTWAMGRLLRSSKGRLWRCVRVAAVVSGVEMLVALIIVGGIGVDTTSPGFQIASLAVVVVTRITIAMWALGTGVVKSIAAAVGAFVLHAVLAVAFWTPVRAYAIDAAITPSGSMAPTLPQGARFFYDRRLAPRRWDIVVFESAEDPKLQYVKRIVGMPGERVDVLADGVLIDGVPVELPAELRGTDLLAMMDGRPRSTMRSSVTLGDEYYVIGDDARVSDDSRVADWSYGPGMSTGMVPRDKVRGVARMLYTPVREFRVFR